MSYPDDPNSVRLSKGESAPVELPYAGYQQEQYLDPYTGQPLSGDTQQPPQYGEQPHGAFSDQNYQQYPAQQYQQYPAPPYPGYPVAPYGQAYPVAPRTNGMAIGALVGSIAGASLCGIGAIIGTVLGHIALRQIKQSGEQGRGMAIAGIVIGYTMAALFLIYLAVLISLATSSEL